MEFKVINDTRARFTVTQNFSMNGGEPVNLPMQFIIARKRVKKSDKSIYYDYYKGKG